MWDGGNVIYPPGSLSSPSPGPLSPSWWESLVPKSHPSLDFWADGALPRLYHGNFLIVMSSKK